jgi:DNA repair protein RecO (recombination protein O)
MSSEKTMAIVLRVIEFSETSCIVTMFTREFGKITAMAKGARRPKSPFEAAIDVLAICRIVFLHKSSDAMDLLTEAKLDRRFRCSNRDLDRLYAGYYLVELLRTMTEENDPHPELFDLAFNTIEEIDNGGPNQEATVEKKSDEDLAGLNLCLLRFEVGLLTILGHFPMLSKCVDCGRPRTTKDQVSFGLNAGGVICRTCRPGKTNVVLVSNDGVDLLLGLAQLGHAQLGHAQLGHAQLGNASDAVSESPVGYKLNPTQPEQTTMIEVRKLMNKYVTHLLGFEPRLHRFLQRLA